MSYHETPAQWAAIETLFEKGFNVSHTKKATSETEGKAVVMSKRQENWLGLVFKTVEPCGRIH